MEDTPENRIIVTKAMFLYKIAFDKHAKAFGGKVTWANQHSLLWGATQAGGFRSSFWLGVCAGLSIEWLKARAAGGDFVSTLLTTRKEAFTTKSADRTKLLTFAESVEDSHEGQNRVKRELNGLYVYQGARASNYPFDGMGDAFPTRRYFYISSASHAMAAYCSWTGSVDFYDPNVGEVKGTTRRFFGTYLKDAVDASFQVTGADVAGKADKVMATQVYSKV